MASPTLELFNTQGRSNWIRLRTLIMLRWFAIGGQIAAIIVADQMFSLSLPIGLCLMAVGTSVIVNLVAMFVYPENKRLSETEAIFTLLFDISQLGLLLALTGGLHNPFALLLLLPVTIAATALRTRSTVILALFAVALVTLVAIFNLPLRNQQGFILRMPSIFVFGEWVAIVIGVVFLGAFARRISSEVQSMSEALAATQMALAREQKLTDLGGVVAAAAHELGTPLATIKLVSAELMEELAERPELFDDAALIREQADRCRDILRSMGRAGKDDLHLRNAPLGTVIREAAEPHAERGKTLHFEIAPGPGGDARQPLVQRRPEIIHGIRNLIQNAVDFARTNVWIDVHWTETTISIRIIDDGPGFPVSVIGRIGDPFVRRRKSPAEDLTRPEYEGMGLGLFIAKTLLERSGAELNFANGSDPYAAVQTVVGRNGAIVEVIFPRDLIVAQDGNSPKALGPNQPIAI